MRETILVAPGIGAGDLVRAMALRGKDMMGLRILNAASLAEEALLRSGKTPGGKLLPQEEEVFVFAEILRDIPYFGENHRLPDCDRVAKTLRGIRCLIPENEEAGMEAVFSAEDAEFPEKDRAMRTAWEEYAARCRDRELVDGVALIRRAIEMAEPMDAEFLRLSEFPLSPLEERLLERLSGGGVRETTVPEFLGAGAPGIPKAERFSEAYGTVNELEAILTHIYENKLPLDECVVAVGNPNAYSQLIRDMTGALDIPVTIGFGVPITGSYPAVFLKLYADWSEGLHGGEALGALLFSEAFETGKLAERLEGEYPRGALKEAAKLCGSLRIGPFRDENAPRLDACTDPLTRNSEKTAETLRNARRVAEELEKGPLYLLNTYAHLRKDGQSRLLDQSALNMITKILLTRSRHSELFPMDEAIRIALAQSVDGRPARSGALHFTDIRGAMSCARKHLYICGLSADLFPGRPRENYLMYDDDYLTLGYEEYAPTSYHRIERANRSLMDLVKTQTALGGETRVSWSGYSLTELKKTNASAAVYDLLKENTAGDDLMAGVEKIDYFPGALTASRFESLLYKEGKLRPAQKNRPGADPAIDPRAWEHSPTEINGYFDCPRAYFLQSVLGIAPPEEEDLTSVATPMDTGNMAHRLMEILSPDGPDRKTFLDRASRMFDDYLTVRVPLDEGSAEREKEAFLEMMESAWDGDSGNEILRAETELRRETAEGLPVHGYPDRIERDGMGNLRVVDFKTGRRVVHTADDPASCRQALIYAWMAGDALDGKVTGCEYRYLRNERSVGCKTTPEIMAALENDLRQFAEALRGGQFGAEPTPDREPCKYCGLLPICEKQYTAGKEDAE